jgi:hypothetical protein
MGQLLFGGARIGQIEIIGAVDGRSRELVFEECFVRGWERSWGLLVQGF